MPPYTPVKYLSERVEGGQKFVSFEVRDHVAVSRCRYVRYFCYVRYLRGQVLDGMAVSTDMEAKGLTLRSCLIMCELGMPADKAAAIAAAATAAAQVVGGSADGAAGSSGAELVGKKQKTDAAADAAREAAAKAKAEADAAREAAKAKAEAQEAAREAAKAKAEAMAAKAAAAAEEAAAALDEAIRSCSENPRHIEPLWAAIARAERASELGSSDDPLHWQHPQLGALLAHAKRTAEEAQRAPYKFVAALRMEQADAILAISSMLYQSGLEAVVDALVPAILQVGGTEWLMRYGRSVGVWR